jgi:hypothetical protein
MKLLLVFFLSTIQFAGSGQSLNFGEIPEGGTPIALPRIGLYNDGKITNQNAHGNLFGMMKGHLPEIDFGTNDMHCHLRCSFCADCRADSQECHRNACSHQPTWYLMPKSAASGWQGDLKNAS